MTQKPTSEKERFAILDVMRGLALMGIALANFPEFALWTFLSGEEQAAMPTAAVDHTVRYLQYLLVDGKFYTIFSILFGIGFSLILAHHGRRLHGRPQPVSEGCAYRASTYACSKCRHGAARLFFIVLRGAAARPFIHLS